MVHRSSRAFAWVQGMGLFVSLVFASSASAREYLVKLKKVNSFKQGSQSFSAKFGLKILDQHKAGKLIKINISEPDAKEHARRLVDIMHDETVEYVVPNSKIKALQVPDDPRYSEQWALAKVRAENAWNTTKGNRSIVVAVIDTGIDYKHPDLAANMWTNTQEIPDNDIDDDKNGYVDDVVGWDFNKGDDDPMDATSSANPGHGTHCAGIIGAVGNNAEGISGINQMVSLMAVRFLGEDGSGDLLGGIKSIDYAIANGAHVISASWGASISRSNAEPLIEAVKRASDKGVIFVAAASNDGASNDKAEMFPANASFANTITVAASRSDDTKPSWSNWGRHSVHLSAPGNSILSTLPSNGYGLLSGTSMATPLVAGLAALMLSSAKEGNKARPSGEVLRSIMQSTGSKVDIETACDCRIDAEAAVNSLTDNKLVVVPASLVIPPEGKHKFTAFGGEGNLTFSVSNGEVASIDENGVLTAIAKGETRVRVIDAAGNRAESLPIRVWIRRDTSNYCPIGITVICDFICWWDPSFYWCEEK